MALSVEWRWKRFAELSANELYGAIHLRERVFIVEQRCAYLDVDGKDQVAWHLMGYEGDLLRAYLRVLPPGSRFPEISIGRVVVAPEARRLGLGREMTLEALRRIEETFGKVPLRISAQAYLDKFYRSFGFQRVGEEYLEDGIPHFEMLRP